jgi:hypothetical protein
MKTQMPFNNEIEKTKQEIEVLTKKLSFLEELSQTKSPCEIAYKRVYGEYPMGEPFWIVFKKGYEAHQSLVDDANKIIAAASMTNCTLEGNPPNGCSAWSEWFELFGSKGILNGLRLSTKEYQPTPQERGDQIHKEVEKLQEKNWYVDAKDLIESGTEPSEPTSTVFRQKLFDGIKSVFYDPDYERTHWKLKVDMAVDEVLTHFYDIIPDKADFSNQNYDAGFNDCIDNIKIQMELVE